jgi:hypothetical protein
MFEHGFFQEIIRRGCSQRDFEAIRQSKRRRIVGGAKIIGPVSFNRATRIFSIRSGVATPTPAKYAKDANGIFAWFV